MFTFTHAHLRQTHLALMHYFLLLSRDGLLMGCSTFHPVHAWMISSWLVVSESPAGKVWTHGCVFCRITSFANLASASVSGVRPSNQRQREEGVPMK